MLIKTAWYEFGIFIAYVAEIFYTQYFTEGRR
jgi:hypothetical protein